jgi:hypothetical protein
MSDPENMIDGYESELGKCHADLAACKHELAESRSHSGKCVKCGKWTCGYCGISAENGDWYCEVCTHGRHTCGAVEELADCDKYLRDPNGRPYHEGATLQERLSAFVSETDREIENLEQELAAEVKRRMMMHDSYIREKDRSEQKLAEARTAHCQDCCCARSWKALGVTEHTGKSIPEHITDLRADLAAYKQKLAEARWEVGDKKRLWIREQNLRLQTSMSLAEARRDLLSAKHERVHWDEWEKVNKELAEAQRDVETLKSTLRSDEEQLKLLVDRNAALRDAAVIKHQGDEIALQAVMEERDRLKTELTDVMREVQRHQPSGSPCPGGAAQLTGWVFEAMVQELAEARKHNSELERQCTYLSNCLSLSQEKSEWPRCEECNCELTDYGEGRGLECNLCKERQEVVRLRYVVLTHQQELAEARRFAEKWAADLGEARREIELQEKIRTEDQVTYGALENENDRLKGELEEARQWLASCKESNDRLGAELEIHRAAVQIRCNTCGHTTNGKECEVCGEIERLKVELERLTLK